MAEMTAEQAAEWERSPSFRVVWDTLQEAAEQIKEVGRKQAKTDELFKEVGRKQAKTDEQLTRLEKTVERIGNNVGGLNGSMGELVETLIAPHLGEKFEAWHYNLKRIFHRVYIYDDTNIQRGEIDILLSDTTVCMATEVKRWLEKTDQVDEHIKRMQLIRKYPPAETKDKKLLGAIAGAVVTPEVREYTERNGFFVLELTGEDVRLLEPPKDFKPKEW